MENKEIFNYLEIDTINNKKIHICKMCGIIIDNFSLKKCPNCNCSFIKEIKSNCKRCGNRIHIKYDEDNYYKIKTIECYSCGLKEIKKFFKNYSKKIKMINNIVHWLYENSIELNSNSNKEMCKMLLLENFPEVFETNISYKEIFQTYILEKKEFKKELKIQKNMAKKNINNKNKNYCIDKCYKYSNKSLFNIELIIFSLIFLVVLLSLGFFNWKNWI